MWPWGGVRRVRIGRIVDSLIDCVWVAGWSGRVAMNERDWIVNN